MATITVPGVPHCAKAAPSSYTVTVASAAGGGRKVEGVDHGLRRETLMESSRAAFIKVQAVPCLGLTNVGCGRRGGWR